MPHKLTRWHTPQDVEAGGSEVPGLMRRLHESDDLSPLRETHMVNSGKAAF